MDQAYNTKKLLGNTLIELMAEKPFDKITVSELTKRCGVNRQTFYYHFETIIDLYKWVLQEEAGPLLAKITSDPYQWKNAVLEILYFMKDNAQAVLSALRSIENQQIRAFFVDYFRQVFGGLFDFICQDLDVDQDFKDFIAGLHITGAAGLAIQWLESGMKESPEQIAEWLGFYLEGNIRGTFERYAEKKAEKSRGSENNRQTFR